MAETLKFLIEVIIDKGEAAIERITEKLEGIGDHSKSAADATNINMAAAGATMAAAGIAIGGTLFAMSEHAAHLGDELHDMSMRTGVTVEQLQVLGFAAEQSGSSLEGVSSGLKFLAKNLVAAAEEMKGPQAAAFKALGVSVRDTEGNIKGAGDAVLEIADRFATMRDGTEKTALAIQLFGRGGIAMIPMLNEGSEGIRHMGAQLELVNGIMGTDATIAADKFKDASNLLSHSIEAFSIIVGTALIPSLTSVVETITDVVAGFSSFEKAHPELIRLSAALAVTLVGSGGVLVGLAGISLLLPSLTAGIGLVGGPILLLGGAFAGLAAVAYTFREELASIILTIGSKFVGAVGVLIGAIATAAGAVGMAGLHDSLMSAKFATEETAKSYSSMAETFKTGEAVTIGNTKAVDQWIEKHKTIPTILEKTDLAMKERVLLIEGAAKEAIAIYEQEEKERLALIEGASKEAIAIYTQEEKERYDLIIGAGKEAQSLYEQQEKDRLDLILGAGKEATAMYDQEEKERLALILGAGKEVEEAYKKRADSLKNSIEDVKKSAGEVFDAVFLGGDDRKSQREKLNKEINDMEASQERYRLQLVIDNAQAGSAAQKTAKADLVAFNKRMDEFESAQQKQHLQDLLDKLQDINRSAVSRAFHEIDDLSKAFAISLGRSLFQSMAGQIFGPLKAGFDEFFEGLLKSTGLSNLISGLGSKLGGIFGGGGGGGGDFVGPTIDMLKGGSSAPSGGGGAGGLVSKVGGLAGGINMVSGIAGAAGSIMGAIGTMRLEGTMNAVEHNTRYLSIDFENTMNELLWPFLPHLAVIREAATLANNQLDAIWFVLADRLPQLGGGSATVPSPSRSSSVMATPATGNVVTPVPGQGGVPPISVSPQFNFYGQQVDRQFIRDVIVPEITQELMDGINSVREQWAQIFENSKDGLVSTAVAGT